MLTPYCRFHPRPLEQARETHKTENAIIIPDTIEYYCSKGLFQSIEGLSPQPIGREYSYQETPRQALSTKKIKILEANTLYQDALYPIICHIAHVLNVGIITPCLKREQHNENGYWQAISSHLFEGKAADQDKLRSTLPAMQAAGRNIEALTFELRASESPEASCFTEFGNETLELKPTDILVYKSSTTRKHVANAGKTYILSHTILIDKGQQDIDILDMLPKILTS